MEKILQLNESMGGMLSQVRLLALLGEKREVAVGLTIASLRGSLGACSAWAIRATWAISSTR